MPLQILSAEEVTALCSLESRLSFKKQDKILYLAGCHQLDVLNLNNIEDSFPHYDQLNQIKAIVIVGDLALGNLFCVAEKSAVDLVVLGSLFAVNVALNGAMLYVKHNCYVKEFYWGLGPTGKLIVDGKMLTQSLLQSDYLSVISDRQDQDIKWSLFNPSLTELSQLFLPIFERGPNSIVDFFQQVCQRLASNQVVWQGNKIPDMINMPSDNISLPKHISLSGIDFKPLSIAEAEKIIQQHSASQYYQQPLLTENVFATPIVLLADQPVTADILEFELYLDDYPGFYIVAYLFTQPLTIRRLITSSEPDNSPALIALNDVTTTTLWLFGNHHIIYGHCFCSIILAEGSGSISIIGEVRARLIYSDQMIIYLYKIKEVMALINARQIVIYGLLPEWQNVDNLALVKLPSTHSLEQLLQDNWLTVKNQRTVIREDEQYNLVKLLRSGRTFLDPIKISCEDQLPAEIDNKLTTLFNGLGITATNPYIILNKQVTYFFQLIQKQNHQIYQIGLRDHFNGYQLRIVKQQQQCEVEFYFELLAKKVSSHPTFRFSGLITDNTLSAKMARHAFRVSDKLLWAECNICYDKRPS